MEGGALYARRLQGEIDLEIVEVAAGKAEDPPLQLREECARILCVLERRCGEVWLLDERGEGMTSELFACALSSLCDAVQRVLFVLGGAFGVNDPVRERADAILRLSQMTLPHELCRVVFLGQLYRAVQIRKGSGYHH